MLGIRDVETGTGEEKGCELKEPDDGESSFQYSQLPVARVCRLRKLRVTTPLSSTEVICVL